jgi:hypothetical protein
MHNIKFILRFIIFTIFTFTVITNISAQKKFQKGYIINSDNDTTYCYISSQLSKYSHNIIIKKKLSDKTFVTYEPTQIKKYFLYSNKMLETNTVFINEDSVKVFLNCHIEGKVNFYTVIDMFNETHFYIKSKKTGLKELKITTEIVDNEGYSVKAKRTLRPYLGVLRYALYDCKKIQNKIEKTKLNKKSLIKLIKDYHKYSNFKYVEYRPKMQFQRPEFGIVGGINHFKLDELKKDEIVNRGNQFGFFINYFFPRTYNRYSVEFRYLQFNLNHGKSKIIDSYRVPSLFLNRYFFLRENQKSFLKFGTELWYSSTPKQVKFLTGLGYQINFGKVKIFTDVEINVYFLKYHSFNIGVSI